jgi:hypothetical protein
MAQYFATTPLVRSVGNIGRNEKNLCRHGSHLTAGNPSQRPTTDVTPGTFSAAIRCNSRLPQMPHLA